MKFCNRKNFDERNQNMAAEGCVCVCVFTVYVSYS